MPRPWPPTGQWLTEDDFLAVDVCQGGIDEVREKFGITETALSVRQALRLYEKCNDEEILEALGVRGFGDGYGDGYGDGGGGGGGYGGLVSE